jgi:nucleoside-diphosphate-sugar epimerase
MTVLTAGGSFANAYRAIDDIEIVSSRELSEEKFTLKLSKADVIIHNASSLNRPDLATAVERNFDFTKRLVDTLQSTNPNVHLVFLSSMSILNSRNGDEYADVLEMSPYAYSKYLAETYCLKSGLRNISCVRFSTLFYKDSHKDGLSALINDAVSTGKISLINSGRASRDFLPIDIAAQYVKAITYQRPNNPRIYTLASGEPKTFGQIAEILKRQLPGLEVSSTQQDEPPHILSDFQTRDIDRLGRINFSLETEISDFIERLRA